MSRQGIIYVIHYTQSVEPVALETRVHFVISPMESSLPGPFNQRVMVHKSSKTFSVNVMERVYMYPKKIVFGK